MLSKILSDVLAQGTDYNRFIMKFNIKQTRICFKWPYLLDVIIT